MRARATFAAAALAAAAGCRADSAPSRAPEAERAAVDPQKPSRERMLQDELARARLMLQKAEEASDPDAVMRANESVERAQAAVEREALRLKRLEELRARTPHRVVEMPSSAPAQSRPAPAVESRPAKVATRVAPSPIAPGPRAAPPPESAPSSAPASSPADSELEHLSKRITWLADLRASTGDHAGATRLRHKLTLLRLDYRDGKKEASLAALRALEREADR